MDSSEAIYFQNVVSLGATKVTPNENIRSAIPVKRNCYFGDEYHLTAHQNYSQVRPFSEISKISICSEAFEIFYRLHAYWSAVSGMHSQNGMMMPSAYLGFTPLWIPM